jgi:hypothetical protein
MLHQQRMLGPLRGQKYQAAIFINFSTRVYREPRTTGDAEAIAKAQAGYPAGGGM